MDPGFKARTAFSLQNDLGKALDEVKQQLGDACKLVLLFVPASQRLDLLGPLIEKAFGADVAACTTAGQFGPAGLTSRGITALGLGGRDMTASVHFIPGLADAASAVGSMQRELSETIDAVPPGWRRYGLLFCDGLSGAEEALISNLYVRMPGFQILGGSAGDDLRFDQTWVYYSGRFHSSAACLVTLFTRHALKPFRVHGVQPLSERVVVTGVSDDRRVITQLNGRPAAEAYAEINGFDPGKLGPSQFARRPFLLKVGSNFYVRSLRSVGPAGELSTYCSLELGQVLFQGEEGDILKSAGEALAKATDGQEPQAVLIFDCVLRRLLLEEQHRLSEANALFHRYRCVGFGAYGEQYNGIHMNQTMTGLVLGGGDVHGR